MSGYSDMIGQATGETEAARLREIENIMRQDVFHSTLDWQSPAQFRKGAKQAAAIMDEIGMPEDAGVTVQGVQEL